MPSHANHAYTVVILPDGYHVAKRSWQMSNGSLSYELYRRKEVGYGCVQGLALEGQWFKFRNLERQMGVSDDAKRALITLVTDMKAGRIPKFSYVPDLLACQITAPSVQKLYKLTH